MFRELLYPHVRWLALVLRPLRPGLFRQGFLFLHHFGEAQGMLEALAEVRAYSHEYASHHGRLRRALKFRVSGRRAVRLAGRLFDGKAA
jgi:hypothetical protein